MVPGSNGVQRALMKRHSENAYYELMRGSVWRKHLAQEVSTLVANQSARARKHDLIQQMDSLGSQDRCVSDARCESIVAQDFLSKLTNARQFCISFEVTACPFLSDNSE